MNIGYACMALGVPGTKQKTCRLKNAGEESLKQLSANNLNALKNILLYNIRNDIRLFRISSEVIPFGSHQMNPLRWREMFADEFNDIGRIIKENGIRVSMHPGQYTILNSPNADVVKNAVEDLKYHTAFLDALGVGNEHKIIVHIGGVYGSKAHAADRFIRCYCDLDASIKKRLVIENDERCFCINDVLSIGMKTDIPVVFDNLHHSIYSGGSSRSDAEIIKLCAATWKKTDGIQKIHYAQQDISRKAGSHAKSIRIDEFMDFYEKIKKEQLDIMLEVKDKNLSAIKCINCTAAINPAGRLKEEWQKYRHKVFETSPDDYHAVCRLLENKEPDAVSFYQIIEHALKQEPAQNSFRNSAIYFWHVFENIADKKETDQFVRYLNRYAKGSLSYAAIKNFIYITAVKYHMVDFMNSYYFIL